MEESRYKENHGRVILNGHQIKLLAEGLGFELVAGGNPEALNQEVRIIQDLKFGLWDYAEEGEATMVNGVLQRPMEKVGTMATILGSNPVRAFRLSGPMNTPEEA